MAFMSIIAFEKKNKVQLNFAFFLIVDYLIPIPINESSHTSLLGIEEGSIEHILRKI